MNFIQSHIVVFNCTDGEQQVDKADLALSDFFNVKLKGFEGLGNKYFFGKGQ